MTLSLALTTPDAQSDLSSDLFVRENNAIFALTGMRMSGVPKDAVSTATRESVEARLADAYGVPT